MKILIVKLSSLGDVVHSLPLISRLRSHFNDLQLDWLTGPKGIQLLSMMPGLDCVYQLSPYSIRKLQQEKYDYVIDVQGLFKTGLLARLLNPKKAIGFKGTREFADLFYDYKVNVGELFKTTRHIIDLNMALLGAIDQKLVESSKQVKFLLPQIDKTHKVSLDTSSKIKRVLLLPSTTWKSKLWELDYWYELACKLKEDFEVYVTASDSERSYLVPLLKKLKDSNIEVQDYIGKTNIEDLICLIQKMDLVVGLDSGGTHLAAAIGLDYSKPKVVGIYGATSVSRNGPYGFIKNTISLSGLDCIACKKKICPLTHHKCMVDLVPDLVIQKVCSLFESKASLMKNEV